MTNRSLEELYSLVSLAIHRVDLAKAGGDTSLAAAAHFNVSCLEEEIAELLPADNAEGALARRGVLSSALAAKLYPRTVDMADKYLAESDVNDALRSKLMELRAEAFHELETLSTISDVFDPAAKFRIIMP